jgi:UDP-N-acetylmuramoylalanine--D-glutamate ligase
VENALAAASTAFLLGVSKEATTDALRGFSGVEHRLELVRSHHGVAYYNDSKATNVDSAVRAIRAFEGPITLIMGGLDKGTDFSPLRLAMSSQVRRVILIGKASRKLSQTLEDLVPIERATSLAEAVEKASHLALAGEIVLLAPACASFDMFADYEERGRVFKELVHALPGNQEDKNRRVRTE